MNRYSGRGNSDYYFGEIFLSIFCRNRIQPQGKLPTSSMIKIDFKVLKTQQFQLNCLFKKHPISNTIFFSLCTIAMSTICCAQQMPKIEGYYYFACLLHIKLQNDDFQYHFLIIFFFVCVQLFIMLNVLRLLHNYSSVYVDANCFWEVGESLKRVLLSTLINQLVMSCIVLNLN